jgi:osmotically-inducible protein OsmY
LWWSPFVDSDRIDVRVEEGVATLRGTVEDLEERDAALENARDGGAVEVRDRLEVEAVPKLSGR